MSYIRKVRNIPAKGDKYGIMKVVSQFGLTMYKEKLEPTYLMSCACGKSAIVSHNRLKEIKSRGCLVGWKLKTGDNSRLKWGESYLNRLYRNYVKNAKANNRIFDLTKEIFKNIITSDCYYCKRLPNDVWETTIHKYDRHYGKFKYNGIDRINNDLGYTVENSRTCCKTCNRMKSNFTEEQFFAHIKDIFNNIKV